MSRWFVMLYGRNDDLPTPLVKGGEDVGWDDIVLFNSEADAEKVARVSAMGAAFGYEVYEWPS